MTGYSVNICETCDENMLNLIVDVQTEGAGESDNRYFKSAVESAKGKVTCDVEEVYTDGGYHSRDNHKYCRNEGIDWMMRGLSGRPSIYDLSYNEIGELVVFNTVTKQVIPATRSKTKAPCAPRRWVIKDGEHTRRYFEDKDVAVCILRKKIAAQTKEKQNIRNNVEATIFQLGYHYRSNKSRYRSLSKHRMWAIFRCLWINFRRISAWVGTKEAEAAALIEQLLGAFQFYFLRPFFVMHFA
jgi:hypothetical protein